MKPKSETKTAKGRKARLIGFGFVFAFLLSVATVIYTGLMVEGSRADFDVGFRSLTLAPGDVATVRLVFEAEAAAADAVLLLELPPMLAPAAGGLTRPVEVVAGENAYTVELRAVAEGSGTVVARLIGEQPIALERVFVTVGAD